MRVLVTGCAGFVGSHLSEALIARGDEVVGVDCFTDYYPRALKERNVRRLRDAPGFRLHEVDLACADLEPLVEDVDLVYHQAAQPGVRASWGECFKTYVVNNITATQRLLEALKGRKSLRKFVYASSSSIYGDAEAYPTSEAALPQPVSPYGMTKLAAEQLAYIYWRSYGIPTFALRYFTVYGPRQRPDMAFNKFVRTALAGQAIQVYGDGEQTRDFTFVADIVAANLAAGTSPHAGVACNIGGGSRVSVNEVVAMLGKLLGRRIEVEHTEAARGDVRHTSADTRKAAELIGYSPRVDLQEGLAAVVDWVGDGASR